MEGDNSAMRGSFVCSLVLLGLILPRDLAALSMEPCPVRLEESTKTEITCSGLNFFGMSWILNGSTVGSCYQINWPCVGTGLPSGSSITRPEVGRSVLTVWGNHRDFVGTLECYNGGASVGCSVELSGPALSMEPCPVRLEESTETEITCSGLNFLGMSWILNGSTVGSCSQINWPCVATGLPSGSSITRPEVGRSVLTVWDNHRDLVGTLECYNGEASVGCSVELSGE